MIDPVFILIIQLCLGLLFGFASWHKVRDPAAFTHVLDDYDLLPASLNKMLVWLIAGTEAGCAVALLAGQAKAAPVACTLLLAYTGAIGIKLAQGKRDIECGCSGPARKQLLSGWLLVRNGILLCGTLILFVPIQTRSLGWVDVAQILFAVVTATLLYGAAEQMLANRSLLLAHDATLEGRWK
jgi:uncharacterized membrane protein YphA (DoxX/SURF4 family)